MDFVSLLSNLEGFDWDKGNTEKNWLKHNITTKECEEVFYHDSIIIEDTKHSQKEERYAIYGETNSKKPLLVVFTVRKNRIRVISARSQSQRERRIYEKGQKTNSLL